MGNLFGKKSPRSSKQPSITEQDRAVLVKIDSNFLSGKCVSFSFSN